MRSGYTVPVTSAPDEALFGLLIEESLWWPIDGGTLFQAQYASIQY